MTWNGTAGDGFTRGTPWLRFPSDATTRHVAAQTDDGRSVLEFYRALLRLRAASPALREGDYRSIDSAPSVFAYTRSAAEGARGFSRAEPNEAVGARGFSRAEPNEAVGARGFSRASA